MAGISSQALTRFAENKIKYNGIEFNSDLELNQYDAQFRNLDPSIGRWWQIDPVTDGYEDQSPHASMYDNPIRISDPLGDEGGECCGGIGEAILGAVDYVLINASGLMNGMLNTVSGGLISSDPFKFRDKLNLKQQAYYDASVIVGQLSPVIGSSGGKVTPESSISLQTANGPTVTVPMPATVVVVPASTGKKTGSSTERKTGSYTNTHESGKTYSGKGPQSRAKESANRIAREKQDPVINTNWKPAKNSREAFKAEDKRIQENGGANNRDKNYNKVNSPGKKYNELDKKK